MTFDWTRAGFVGVITSIGVFIMIAVPENFFLGVGLILGTSVSIIGIDKKLYKKIKETIKQQKTKEYLS